MLPRHLDEPGDGELGRRGRPLWRIRRGQSSRGNAERLDRTRNEGVDALVPLDRRRREGTVEEHLSLVFQAFGDTGLPEDPGPRNGTVQNCLDSDFGEAFDKAGGPRAHSWIGSHTLVPTSTRFVFWQE